MTPIGSTATRPWSGGRIGRLAAVVALVAASSGLVVSTAAADGPTAFTNSTVINIPATGSANQIGPASPYPSAISVSGMAGLVSNVTVTFNNLTHSTANDIDAMVVAPTGANLVVMSDIGDPETTLAFAANATLTFDDAAAGGLPTGNIPTGTYRPINNAAGDVFPAPAPLPSAQTTLAGAFTGIDPNGVWNLFIVDDQDGDTGSMAGGWSLSITTVVASVATTTVVTTSGTPSTTGGPVTFTATVTSGGPVGAGTVQFTDNASPLGGPVAVNGSGQASVTTSALTEGTHLIRANFSGATGFLPSNGIVNQRVDNQTIRTGNTFCNPGSITIPALGAAQPYPSNITVSGLTGTIGKVTAALNGVSHAVPVDLDILLAAPVTSTNLLLMSDVGGTSPVTGLTVAFDDAAAGPVPTPLTSGTFRPTDSDADSADTPFPPPAPTPSAATTLTTFNGSLAEGTWSLWAHDDASGDSGTISGGWCLTITTTSPTTTTLMSTPNPSLVGQSVTFTAAVAAGGTPVAEGTVTFSVDGTPVGVPVTVAADGTATLTTTTLAAGTHPVVATYVGTPVFLGSSSGTLPQVVNAAATTTTDLTSNVNPSSFGQSVTFTAAVAAGGTPVAEGTVTFSVDGTPVGGPVTVAADGTATLTTTTLAAGTHPVVATYVGTPAFAPSSDTLSQVVNAAATTTLLTSSVNPSASGESVTFTATVTSGATPVAEGAVTFSADGAPVGGPVIVAADGTATLTTAALAPGSHPIVAAYGGTANYTTSDGTITQGVNPEAVAGGPYTVAEGGSLTLDGTGSTTGAATYGWDLNGDNDFTDATGLNPTVTWAQLESLGIDDGPSTETIALQVTLGTLITTSTATQLTVTNTAPVSVITGALTATVGLPFTVKVGADDPSAADMAAMFTYTVDWGDGSPVESVVGPADPPVTHTYTSAGTFAASFTATDKDGGLGEPTSVQVLAAAAPPTTTTPPTSTTTTATTATSTPVTVTTTPVSTTTATTTPTATTPVATTTYLMPSHPTTSSYSSGPLPTTGLDVETPVLVGGGLLVAGAALLLIARRSRRITR